MICAISETLQLKFLAKMNGDIKKLAESEQPFSVRDYIENTYTQILAKTNDPIKAQTFITYVPSNLLSIYTENKSAQKYLRPSLLEFDGLIADFENFDNVATYLKLSEKFKEEQKEDIVNTNLASFSPETIDQEALTAQPEEKAAVATNFIPLGRHTFSTQGFERTPDGQLNQDPVVLASFAFLRKLNNAKQNNFETNPELAEVKLKVVTSKSIMLDLSESDRTFEESSLESGIKVIFVDGNNKPIRVSTSGDIVDDTSAILPNFNIYKINYSEGRFSRKGEPSLEQLEKELRVFKADVDVSRQNEYRQIYNLRNYVLSNPSANIYLDINTISAGFVDVTYSNPIRLSEIDFDKLGAKFIPKIDAFGDIKGKVYFTIPQTNAKLFADRPKLSEVIDPSILVRFMFDQNIDLNTRISVYENLLHARDIKIKQDGVYYNRVPISPEALISELTNAVNFSATSGRPNSIYRANVSRRALEINGKIDIPYYEGDTVNYKSMSVIDYIKNYFYTSAQIGDNFKPTSPYLTYSIPTEYELLVASTVETAPEPTQQTDEVQPAVSMPTGISFKIDTASITDNIANEFKKNAIEKGLSGIFNIPEEVDQMIDPNIKNNTTNFCE
jgi:hypothetical protein